MNCDQTYAGHDALRSPRVDHFSRAVSLPLVTEALVHTNKALFPLFNTLAQWTNVNAESFDVLTHDYQSSNATRLL